MIKNLAELPLFEIFLSIKRNGKWYDLHNEFICSEVSVRDSELIFKMRSETGSEARIVFEEYKILENKFSLGDLTKSRTLDNLQRCKTVVDGELIESTNDGLKCFLIEFYEGQQIELISKVSYLELDIVDEL